MSQNPSRGYLYVATLSKVFFTSALESIRSLKEYYPEAQCALFTHQCWVDEHKDEVNELVDDLFVPTPAFVRTKLWALPRTPYDETAYVDCDTYITHEDIKHIFDQRPVDKEVIMTYNRAYNAKVVYFTEDGAEGPGSRGRELRHWLPEDMKLVEEGIGHTFDWHCGLFVYKKTENTQRLWKLWLDTLLKHYYEEGGHRPYPESMLFWDTFAFWRILRENPDLADIIGEFPGPGTQRWNFVRGYREHELEGTEPVIHHYSIGSDNIKEGYLHEKDIELEWGNLNCLR